MLSEFQSQKYEKALHYEIFVKEEYWFAKNKIQKAECIFDIGWHIGYFSERCRALNTNAEIHYFEPVEQLYKQAIQRLWNDKKIVFNNFWIAAKKEDWMLFLNEEKTMQSSKFHSFLNPKWIEINVQFETLRNYITNTNIEKIDVLKMDIEWMEFEVLSSRTDFERSKIQSLIAEIHILNNEMNEQWNMIYNIIKKKFHKIQIFESWYRKEIFILHAKL